MLEYLILGAVQGIAEWLPVSSEGLIVLVRVNFFDGGDLSDDVRIALFLHLGTFFAGLLYFRKDVVRLTVALVSARSSKNNARSLLIFLLVATLITGAIGFAIAEGEGHSIAPALSAYASLVNALIGLMLLVTGGLLLLAKRKRGTRRTAGGLSLVDAVVLGVVQAFAAVPGLSRSGLTVSALLLRGIKEEDALRVSFLMSLPVVFGANVVFNLNLLTTLDAPHITGLAAAFVFGLLTIHGLLRLARRINFGKFVILFGVLLLLAALL